jgi:hypothetical protein
MAQRQQEPVCPSAPAAGFGAIAPPLQPNSHSPSDAKARIGRLLGPTTDNVAQLGWHRNDRLLLLQIGQVALFGEAGAHHDAIADDGTVVGASAGAELRAEVRKREVTNKSQLCLPFSCVKMCSYPAGKNSRRRLGCQ